MNHSCNSKGGDKIVPTVNSSNINCYKLVYFLIETALTSSTDTKKSKSDFLVGIGIVEMVDEFFIFEIFGWMTAHDDDRIFIER